MNMIWKDLEFNVSVPLHKSPPSNPDPQTPTNHVVCTSFHAFFTLHRHVHISRYISFKNEIQTDLFSTTRFFTQPSPVNVRLCPEFCAMSRL